MILDGKIFETDRLAETVTSAKGDDINAWYSGKKHRPGANVQAVMLPGGLPVWTGPAEPGHVHDITAARATPCPLLYRAAASGMPTLADGGYEGAAGPANPRYQDARRGHRSGAGGRPALASEQHGHDIR